jgi:hypothetical protein
MEIDYAYASSWSAIEYGQVITLSEFPGIKFLIFHVEKDKIQQGDNRDNSTDGFVNPDSKKFDMHEVPYASTLESQYSRVLVEPVDYSENRGHGTMLKNFYRDNNMQTGDMFLVPVMEDLSKFPKWIPFPVKKIDEKKQKQLQPVPVQKYQPAPVPVQKPMPIRTTPKPQDHTPPVWLIPVKEDALPVIEGILEDIIIGALIVI